MRLFERVVHGFFDMPQKRQDDVLRHLLRDYLDEVREDFGDAGEKLALASILEKMGAL